MTAFEITPETRAEQTVLLLNDIYIRLGEQRIVWAIIIGLLFIIAWQCTVLVLQNMRKR